jgi:plastocyanin
MMRPRGAPLSSRSKAALVGAAVAALAIPAGASAATKVVAVGPPVTKAPPGFEHVSADVPQFFGETTTIHVGDTIRWKLFGFHDIYFPKKGGKNLSLPVADPTRKYGGEVDPAGQPLWFNGQPQIVANPAAVFPVGGKTEDGSKANGSGLPDPSMDPAKFKYSLKFTKVGTYTYYCTLHPHMRGHIKVLPKTARIPSVAADKRVVDKQVAAAIAQLRRDLKRKDAAGNVVEMGRDRRDTTLLAIYPAKKTVAVGSTVEFRMSAQTNEIHTVTFGSDAVLAKGGYAEKVSQGLLAPLPGTGQNGPPVLGFPGTVVFPSDPGPLVFNGTQHGGFVSTGLLGREAPLRPAAKVTFTAPGTYNFVCLVHPEMKGQIVVQ